MKWKVTRAEAEVVYDRLLLVNECRAAHVQACSCYTSLHNNRLNRQLLRRGCDSDGPDIKYDPVGMDTPSPGGFFK